jgi:hypothetical protein
VGLLARHVNGNLCRPPPYRLAPVQRRVYGSGMSLLRTRLMILLAPILLAPGLNWVVLAADVDDPILGVWKLNLAKSKYIPGPPPRSQTRAYRFKDDEIFVTIETVDSLGQKQPTIEFPERYDGKEYPVKGSALGDMLTLKRINNYLAEATVSHSGIVVAVARRIVTDNGKTLMLIYQETSSEHPVDNVIVYDRQ